MRIAKVRRRPLRHGAVGPGTRGKREGEVLMEMAAVDSATRDHVIGILGMMPAFQMLSTHKDNLVQVCNAGRLVDFAPDETLVTQATSSDSFFVILDGTVSIFTERGEEQRVHL